MDAKIINTGLVVVAALAAGGIAGKLTSDPKPTPAEWTVAEGATEWTKAVAEIARANGPEIKEIRCNPEREGTKDGIQLAYVCPGMGRLPDKKQDEVNKTCPGATAIRLIPTVDGKNVSYKTECETGGVLPNLDPVEELPKPVEAKPSEEPPAEEIVEKVP